MAHSAQPVVFDCAVTSSVFEFGDHANPSTRPIAVSVTALARCVATLTTRSWPVSPTRATLRESADHIGGDDRYWRTLPRSRSTFERPLVETSRRVLL